MTTNCIRIVDPKAKNAFLELEIREGDILEVYCEDWEGDTTFFTLGPDASVDALLTIQNWIEQIIEARQ